MLAWVENLNAFFVSGRNRLAAAVVANHQALVAIKAHGSSAILTRHTENIGGFLPRPYTDCMQIAGRVFLVCAFASAALAASEPDGAGLQPRILPFAFPTRGAR